MRRLVAVFAVVALAVAMVVALRETTMSRHTSAAPGSLTVVRVTTEAHRLTRSVSLSEATRALIARCRLEVHDESPFDAPVHRLNADTFTFRLEPALDPTDKRQLHGCLEDILVDHLQVDVESMHDEPTPRPAAPEAHG